MFFIASTVSQSFSYSQIEDANVTEIGPSSRGEILENFDLNANQKLQSDLDVLSNLSENARMDMIGRTVASAVEDVKANVDSSLHQTKRSLDSLKDEVARVPGSITEEQMQAIDQKLEALQGTACVSELNALSGGAQASAPKMAGVIKESIKKESSSFGQHYVPGS